jgi:hypothetical protein
LALGPAPTRTGLLTRSRECGLQPSALLIRDVDLGLQTPLRRFKFPDPRGHPLRQIHTRGLKPLDALAELDSRLLEP